jgi:hypothetical protein
MYGLSIDWARLKEALRANLEKCGWKKEIKILCQGTVGVAGATVAVALGGVGSIGSQAINIQYGDVSDTPPSHRMVVVRNDC